jgi:hypothetical protein
MLRRTGGLFEPQKSSDISFALKEALDPQASGDFQYWKKKITPPHLILTDPKNPKSTPFHQVLDHLAKYLENCLDRIKK